MLLGRVALGIGALAFVGHGLLCIILPETLSSEAGLGIGSPPAVTEIRAEYGGLPIALGLLFAYAAARSWTPGLVVLVVICAGYSSVRAVSLFLQPEFDSYNVQAMLFELAVGSLGAVALVRTRVRK